MYRRAIAFQPYTIADTDKIAVYSKLKARHAATGLEYFSRLRTSTTLAIKGISDGMGEDLLHSATQGRYECAEYAHIVAHLLPLSLASFDILLEDFGDYQKLERSFQYSYIQEAIDNDMMLGGTGRTASPTAKSKKLVKSAPLTITQEMVKTGETLEALMLSILKKKSLVKIFLLYADGVKMAEIADIVGDTVKSVEHHIYRAKAKLAKAGIEAYLK